MDFSQLKLQWLLYFVDLAKTKNFSKTAANNYTTQPNVSYAIKSLEKMIGVSLFIRKDNEVALSKYGKLFLPYVEESFSNLKEGCNVLNNSINPLSGDVQIGFSYIFSLSVIPDLFRFLYADFIQKALPINISTTMVHINEDTSCVDDIVLDGGCHLGITCVQARPGCSYEPISEQELVLLLPTSHPLAQQKTLTLNDVRNEPFILLNGDSELLGYYEKMFAHDQICPRLLNSGLDWLSILVQVSAGKCLTIAPKGGTMIIM